MAEVKTARLRLVSGTPELAQAELSDLGRFGTLLNAAIPPQWPPETLRDAQALFLSSCLEVGNCGPWTLGWYGLLEITGEATLCGSVGFKGPPGTEGTAEIGYAVLPGYQRRGIASEMVSGLSRWALDHPGVKAIEADVAAENLASVRVLEKAGFVAIGPGKDAGTGRFRLRGSPGQGVRAKQKKPP